MCTRTCVRVGVCALLLRGVVYGIFKSMKQRLIIGISGGSGMIYAQDLLRTLKPLPVETHVILTNGAKQVIPTELTETAADLLAMADVVYKDTDLGAAVSSGSFITMGMVIVPCSAGSLAKIAVGLADNLLARAAHVSLKEKRRLILVVREAPYSRPMLQNMLSAHDAGAIILPASPGFYQQPQSIHDLVGGITARTLDLMGITHQRSSRWKDSSV